MQLLLIRHSITAGNLEHRYIGCRTDEPLCEAGIALAQQKSVEFRRSFPAPELVLVSALPADGRDPVSPYAAENRMGTTGVRFRSIRRKKLSGVVR